MIFLIVYYYTYTRTKASILCRQIGHIFSEYPHGTHVVTCPQGKKANSLSSIQHKEHRLDDDESSSKSAVTSTSVVPMAFFEDISSAVGKMLDDLGCSFSRIDFIRILGTTIFSLLPLIQSI